MDKETISEVYNNAMQVCPTNKGVMAITSICPVHEQEAQAKNVKSWQNLGMTCFSINHPNEQSSITYPPNINVIKATDEDTRIYKQLGKYFVSIDTIFSLFKQHKNDYSVFVLINSDIHLEFDPVFFDHLVNLVKSGQFVFVRRHDYIETTTNIQIIGPAGGADMFMFNIDHLALFESPTEYFLGCPIFDEWILHTLVDKHKIKTTFVTNQPFALHLRHKANWTRDVRKLILNLTHHQIKPNTLHLCYNMATTCTFPFGMFVLPQNGLWQYPCITEKHAFDCLVSTCTSLPNNIKYYAINWATLIDQNKIHLAITDEFAQKYACPSGFIGVTVCQSIQFKKIANYFQKLNITVLFTPHKTKSIDAIGNISLKPFPLYAVNVEDSIQNVTIKYNAEKDILASFIGACLHKAHISNIRQNILKLKDKNVPNVVIIDTGNGWHFNDIVYSYQCAKKELNNKQLTSYTNNTAIYNDILCRSRFSLCPSGTGPNSLRFWESLATGSIPILLADTLDLPTVPDLQWKDTIVQIDENKIENLFSIISEITPEQETRMRNNCYKMYSMFSKNKFSRYIVDSLTASSTKSQPQKQPAPRILQTKITTTSSQIKQPSKHNIKYLNYLNYKITAPQTIQTGVLKQPPASNIRETMHKKNAVATQNQSIRKPQKSTIYLNKDNIKQEKTQKIQLNKRVSKTHLRQLNMENSLQKYIYSN